jgi:7-cyano-7-deazaguanine synthase
MTSSEAQALLPDVKGCVVILSGGMDSTIAMRLAVEKYGKDNVSALTFYYGQKQRREIEMARMSTNLLGVKHKVVDASFLGDISKGFSANVDTDMAMPTIKDVLGDPQPKTYVPFRNLILLSLTLAQAEATDASYVFTGLQVHDEYGYWDTTQRFVDSINTVAEQNRTHKVKIVAPFSHLSKHQEIEICKELKLEHLLQYTLTCYNPSDDGESCGKCPSCAERIANFAKAGLEDPVDYSIDIPWDKLIK